MQVRGLGQLTHQSKPVRQFRTRRAIAARLGPIHTPNDRVPARMVHRFSDCQLDNAIRRRNANVEQGRRVYFARRG